MDTYKPGTWIYTSQVLEYIQAKYLDIYKPVHEYIQASSWIHTSQFLDTSQYEFATNKGKDLLYFRLVYLAKIMKYKRSTSGCKNVWSDASSLFKRFFMINTALYIVMHNMYCVQYTLFNIKKLR